MRLYEALHPLLARAACSGAGVPPGDGAAADRRTAELVALFDAAAGGPLSHLRSRRARRSLEHWLGGLVDGERAPGRLCAVVAGCGAGTADAADGGLLPRSVVAAEILNLGRPTVAVSVWIVLALHAVHTEAAAQWLRTRADAAARTACGAGGAAPRPVLSAAMARVPDDFSWRGVRFERDCRALFDLDGTHHDARAWSDPLALRPERFAGEPALPPFAFVPQGGGWAQTGHRCPGEGVAAALTVQALDWLVDQLSHELPPQDLSVAFDRLPAIPRDGMRVRFV